MAGSKNKILGKLSGADIRLQDQVKVIAGHGIHELECLFHVNEVYLTHVIMAREGTKKGLEAIV